MDDADLKYLRQAVELAWEGLGHNSPNPLVGCVIVRDGHIVGHGAHLFEKISHAEVTAIEEAGEAARGATLYVNLEPCCHYGRTPPCTDAIVEAGIKRVVYGIDDPYTKASGLCPEILTGAGIRIDKCDDADLTDEIEDQNRFYLYHKRYGRPYVTYKAAASLDGSIATREGDSKWISNTEALALAHLLRGVYDAVLIGSRTAIADDPQLTYRPDEAGFAEMPDVIFPHTPKDLKTPLRVVIDAALKLPDTLKVFNMELAPTIVFCSEDTSQEAAAHLAGQGVEVVRVSRGERGLDLSAILMKLGEKGIQSLLVEGGGDTAGRFFDAKLINEVNMIFAPLIIGGSGATPVIGGEGPSHLNLACGLVDMKCRWIGRDLLVVGKLQTKNA